MALIRCPECDHSISNRAPECPHCGFPLAKKHADKSRGSSLGSCGGCLILTVVVGYFCFTGIDGCFKGLEEARRLEEQRRAALMPAQRAAEDEAKEKQRRAADAARAEAEARANPVTAGKYNRIETGMTYDQVRNIIGVDGEELSRVAIGGIETVLISWANRNGSNMNVTFQNGRVVAKAQLGLR